MRLRSQRLWRGVLASLVTTINHCLLHKHLSLLLRQAIIIQPWLRTRMPRFNARKTISEYTYYLQYTLLCKMPTVQHYTLNWTWQWRVLGSPYFLGLASSRPRGPDWLGTACAVLSRSPVVSRCPGSNGLDQSLIFPPMTPVIPCSR